MIELEKAAQQAVEEWRTDPGSVRMASLMMMLESALAAPEQEPVAAHQALEALDELEASARGDEPFNHFAAPLVRQFIEQTLYTAPPQREPLGALAIADIYIKWDETPGASMADFARAIEAAHGIKEQT